MDFPGFSRTFISSQLCVTWFLVGWTHFCPKDEWGVWHWEQFCIVLCPETPWSTWLLTLCQTGGQIDVNFQRVCWSGPWIVRSRSIQPTVRCIYAIWVWPIQRFRFRIYKIWWHNLICCISQRWQLGVAFHKIYE